MILKRVAGITGALLLIFILIWVIFLFFNRKSVDQLLVQLEQEDFSGVVLIAHGEEIVYQAGYGYASCDERVHNTVDTILAIGSITKMFTDVAIGQLADQGKLNIDDPISLYFENLPAGKEPITIRQLMQHTAGLDTYHETGELGDFEQMTSEKAFKEIMNRPLLSSPGSKENYSNSGYTLLALLIEEVSGQDYTHYVREHILNPAGMNSTGFWGESFDPIASTPNVVLGCSSPDGWHYSWVLVGNGGMVSTVGDMHQWVLALQDETILSPSAKAWIGYDQIFQNGFGSAGGSSQHEFNATIEHSGQNDVTVIAISNRDTLPAENFAIQLLRAAVREKSQ